MRRISEYKNLKHNNTDDNSKKYKYESSKLDLSYNIATVLAKYNVKFSNIGCEKVKVRYFGSDMKTKNHNSVLFSNTKNAFTTPIFSLYGLEYLKLSSHEKVEISLLSHNKLRKLHMSNIGMIKKKGKLRLKLLSSLVIENCRISYKAFQSFLKLENLKDLEMTGVDLVSKSRRKILEAFKSSTGLKRLIIENCNFDEKIYYQVSRSLSLNNFRFATTNGYVSFDVTVTSSSRVIFSNFDPRFYGHVCHDVKSVICFDSFLEVHNLKRLNVDNLVEFSTKNVKIDNVFVEDFLFRFASIQRLSLVRCYLDSTLIYKILRKYKKSLRYLDVSGVLVPFDFIIICKTTLNNCHIKFGRDSNTFDVT